MWDMRVEAEWPRKFSESLGPGLLITERAKHLDKATWSQRLARLPEFQFLSHPFAIVSRRVRISEKGCVVLAEFPVDKEMCRGHVLGKCGGAGQAPLVGIPWSSFFGALFPWLQADYTFPCDLGKDSGDWLGSWAVASELEPVA